MSRGRTNETSASRGPVAATLKVVVVLMAIVAAGLLVLMLIGFTVGPRQAPSPERIRAECSARFANLGDQAVEHCTTELLRRAASDERERMLDEAYRASTRPE
jgi:hypothetical protein